MIFPAGVIRPIRSPYSVNHRAPSGPAVMSAGPRAGSPKREIFPEGVMRPMRRLWNSVNQTLPSGPTVIPSASARPAPPCADAVPATRTTSAAAIPATSAACQVHHLLLTVRVLPGITDLVGRL